MARKADKTRISKPANKLHCVRQESLYRSFKPLTAANPRIFLSYIPLKVTLAIRSDLPRRFEQVFRRRSNDIFGEPSTPQHGDGKCEGESFCQWFARTNQIARRGTVGLARNNWSSICAFVRFWIIHFL